MSEEEQTPQSEVPSGDPQDNGQVPASFPERALEISFDPGEMTLDEAVLFEPDGFSVKLFRQFLIDHSNWTVREIGSVKVRDLKALADQVIEQFQEEAVPNPS